MLGPTREQRVRDPLHNLVEFRPDQFESTLWRVIQTRPFQRLRRIRQLGFSELVFPGATHTRFAHSIGVFHTARNLMTAIERTMDSPIQDHQLRVALAASLVHDVGHGMFSHSFEQIGKALDLPMAQHEKVSETLIREGEIAEAFRQELGSGFANDVADVLGRKEPTNLYDSIVSSQFDADRLDYMQRDRLMTGVQSSGIDATWLMSNLEIGSLQVDTDDEASRTVQTLVLGPKAFHAAENYVLSLFQLYPNIYLHKTTRGAEKIFGKMMLRVFQLLREDRKRDVGLPPNHPFRRFAEEPENIDNVLALDDAVFWGTLSMLVEARDPLISNCASRLQERRLPKCIDIRRRLDERETSDMGRKEKQARLSLTCNDIAEKIRDWASARAPDQPQIFVDEDRRAPYKKFQESKSLLNQILIKHGEEHFVDMARLSPVVASAETFVVCRAYHDEDDTEGQSMIENIIGTNQLNGGTTDGI